MVFFGDDKEENVGVPFFSDDGPDTGNSFYGPPLMQVIEGYSFSTPGGYPHWLTGPLPDDGPGNDIVVVGNTRAQQYSEQDLTTPLGTNFDLSDFIRLDAVNDRDDNSLKVDTSFEGGVNRMFVYGDADFTNAELKYIDWILPVDAEVTFSAQQLAKLDPGVLVGSADGSSLRVTNAEEAPVILALDSRIFRDFNTLHIEEGVTLVVDQSALEGMQYITGEGTIRASDWTGSLDLSGVTLSVDVVDEYGRPDAGHGGTVVEGELLVAGNGAQELFAGAGNDRLIGGQAADVLKGGAGNDVLRGGQGTDEMYGGDGDDAFVLLGDLSVGGKQDSEMDTFLLGEPLSTLNGQNFDLSAQGTIDGGNGNNTLYVYGNADLTDYAISNIDNIVVRSDVIFTTDQLQGVEDLQGDGRSIITINNEGNTPVEYDLSQLDLSGIGQIEIGQNVTLRVNNLDDLGGARILTGMGTVQAKDTEAPIDLTEEFSVLSTVNIKNADGSDASGAAGELSTVIKAKAPGEVYNTARNDYLVGTEYEDVFHLDKDGDDVVNARDGDDIFEISGGGTKTLLSSGGIETIDLSLANGPAEIELTMGGTIAGDNPTDIILGTGGGTGGVFQEAPENNAMIIIDVSGSMGGQNIIDTKQAINDLLDAYENLGDVAVRLVTFNSYANSDLPSSFNGGAWMDAQTARDIVATLSAGGGTNYRAALNEAMAAHGVGRENGYLDGGAKQSFFLSDGVPGTAVSAQQEAQWHQFLIDNQITSNSIGFGGLNNIDPLRPISFDGVTGQNIEPMLEVDSANLGTVVVEQARLDFIENLTGTQHGDELTGNSLDNVINGTGGDNIFKGLGGDDILTGTEDGDDTAVFRGTRDEYNIVDRGNVVVVTDKIDNRDGVDHLFDVEALEFSDQTTVIDSSGPANPDDLTQYASLNFHKDYGVNLENEYRLFDFNLDNILDFEGAFTPIDWELLGNSLEVGLEYLLNADFGLSLPVGYEISSGEVSIDYSVDDSYVTWPELITPGEAFEVATGLEFGLGDKAKVVPGQDPQLSVDDDIGFEFNAGLLFDWDVEAMLDMFYEYDIPFMDGGDSIDILGNLGAEGRIGDNPYHFQSLGEGEDYKDSPGYLPLLSFSAGEEASQLKSDILEYLGNSTLFEQDGTLSVNAFGFGLEADLNNFKLFGDGFDSSSDYQGGNEFLTIESEHIPDDSPMSLSLDVDDLIGNVLSLAPEPVLQSAGKFFQNLDEDFEFDLFSNEYLDVSAAASYDLLSMDAVLNISPATKLEFTPTHVQVDLTPSWGEPGVSGELGESFQFTVPEGFSGDLALDADYSLFGDLSFGLGISLDPELQVKALNANGEAVADIDISLPWPLPDIDEQIDAGFELDLFEENYWDEYTKEFYPEAFSFDIPALGVPVNNGETFQFSEVVA